MSYISIVYDTTQNYGEHNSGFIWFVGLNDNPTKMISMTRNEAKKLVCNKTKYTVEKKSAVYKMNGEKRYNIKWKGFKNLNVVKV